jgi:hypothetical protein
MLNHQCIARLKTKVAFVPPNAKELLIAASIPRAEWPGSRTSLILHSLSCSRQCILGAQRGTMVVRALEKLMRDDCGGRIDSMLQPDGLLLGGMKACKTFTKDAYVTIIEGFPARGNAQATDRNSHTLASSPMISHTSAA